ncbi:hypothetical protein FIA58_009150 [Flavobacterium jejuense]|uniref:Uncharacterized protein n=1 Tax=Flavobacterium jejuense TaxID=1544455 RepID=A0ABX0IVK4_9FLAO|nr:hypothetical protein [Flavobacterium jejuense]NHN25839.1 hypothetical protein [Flavobacterium jejuense]
MARPKNVVVTKKVTKSKNVAKPTLTEVRRWIQKNDAEYLQEIINKPAN